MIKQRNEILNSVPLKEAAKIISDEVIKKRFTLNEEIKELEERHKKYEQDYIDANDGDASENAPLDKARENLRLNMGERVSRRKLIQKMDKIDEATYIIGTYNYEEIERYWDALTPESRFHIGSFFNAETKEQFLDFIKNSSRNDLTQVLEALLNHAKEEPSMSEVTETNLMSALVKFYHARKKPKYNSCGTVSIYSTVRMLYDGSVITFAIYPVDISFIDIGVMAANSRLSSVLLGKKKGDKVTIPNSSTFNNLTCEILDVY